MVPAKLPFKSAGRPDEGRKMSLFYLVFVECSQEGVTCCKSSPAFQFVMFLQGHLHGSPVRKVGKTKAESVENLKLLRK